MIIEGMMFDFLLRQNELIKAWLFGSLAIAKNDQPPAEEEEEEVRRWKDWLRQHFPTAYYDIFPEDLKDK